MCLFQGSQFRIGSYFDLVRGTKYFGIGVPFQNYCYLYISIHLYMFVFIYVSMNLLIFILINIKFKLHIFYKPKYSLSSLIKYINLNNMCFLQIFLIVPTKMLIPAKATEISQYSRYRSVQSDISSSTF